MAQIPVSEDSYSRLAVLKARSIVAKKGGSVTWDDVISAQLDICNLHSTEFFEVVTEKAGKTRTSMVTEMVNKNKELGSVSEVKESLEKGDTVTSEQLENVKKVMRLKE